MVDRCDRNWQDDRADDQLRAYIQRRLGCDVIGVELSDDQIDDAIRDSAEYWMMWVGRVRSVMLTLRDDTEYPASDLGSDVDSVVDVFWPTDGDVLNNMFGWADVEFNPFQYTFNGNSGYSSFVQYMQYREQSLRTVSADKDWVWDKARRMLIVGPVPSAGTKIRVNYLSRCFDYDYLSTYEWKLFKDYAVCKAMRTLAIIRMKFADKPSATGSFNMDGDAMWANAEAMEMQIEEKMRNLSKPTGIITG